MVSRQAFINKLRDLNYRYKNQQKRTQLWRHAGGTHRIFVPLCDLLDDEYGNFGEGLLDALNIPI